MSINIITEFNTKEGQASRLLELLREILQETADYEGAEEVSIRQNVDDPNNILSVHRWVSREAYESYVTWRTEKGVADQIGDLLAGPPSMRFYEEILRAVHAG